MNNKVAPNICAPGSAKFPQSGPHNPNVGTRDKGKLAPKPKFSKPDQNVNGPAVAGIARVKQTPTGPKAAGNTQTNAGFFGR